MISDEREDQPELRVVFGRAEIEIEAGIGFDFDAVLAEADKLIDLSCPQG